MVYKRKALKLPKQSRRRDDKGVSYRKGIALYKAQLSGEDANIAQAIPNHQFFLQFVFLNKLFYMSVLEKIFVLNVTSFESS